MMKLKLKCEKIKSRIRAANNLFSLRLKLSFFAADISIIIVVVITIIIIY